MNDHQRRVRAAIREALDSRTRSVAKFVHVYPVGYVVARCASRLDVALPGFDADMPERLRRTAVSAFPLDGDAPIRVGDWVSCAYVSTPQCGEFHAVRYVP